ncbi:MAG: DUF6805 domain-containing protein [Saprospiraceae bacterium]|nr:hypothetical protein [Lewinella sp.]
MKAKLFINDQSVAEIWLDGVEEDHLTTTILTIPDDLQREQTLKVKVQTVDKRWMPKTAEVRLLNQQPS